MAIRPSAQPAPIPRSPRPWPPPVLATSSSSKRLFERNRYRHPLRDDHHRRGHLDRNRPQLGTGIATVTLAGAAPINLADSSDGNGIVANDGDNLIPSRRGRIRSAGARATTGCSSTIASPPARLPAIRPPTSPKPAAAAGW